MYQDGREVQVQQVEGKGVALGRVADPAWLLSYGYHTEFLCNGIQ
jgi:hypothetical protein